MKLNTEPILTGEMKMKKLIAADNEHTKALEEKLKEAKQCESNTGVISSSNIEVNMEEEIDWSDDDQLLIDAETGEKTVVKKSSKLNCNCFY